MSRASPGSYKQAGLLKRDEFKPALYENSKAGEVVFSSARLGLI